MRKKADNPRMREMRENIRADLLIDMLQRYALGWVDKDSPAMLRNMNKERLRAAEILLKKALPDLSAIDMSGELEGDIVLRWQDGTKSTGAAVKKAIKETKAA